MNPGQRKAPEGTGADADTKTYRQPEDYTDPHVTAMYGMAWRIRWLSTRRSDGRYPTHWWLRDFLQQRDAS